MKVYLGKTCKWSAFFRGLAFEAISLSGNIWWVKWSPKTGVSCVLQQSIKKFCIVPNRRAVREWEGLGARLLIFQKWDECGHALGYSPGPAL